MRQPTKIAFLFHKINLLLLKKDFFILKLRGLVAGKGSIVGKITCNWPNKLTLGKDCELQSATDFIIWQPFNDESYIKLGDKVFIGHGCEFVCSSKITIGDNCLIASKSTINDTGHEFSRALNINDQPVTSKEIIIEEDVWIGTSCVILQGVTIGKGAVIAAGSVVNRSIPPYEVWAGVPARFIKKRI